MCSCRKEKNRELNIESFRFNEVCGLEFTVCRYFGLNIEATFDLCILPSSSIALTNAIPAGKQDGGCTELNVEVAIVAFTYLHSTDHHKTGVYIIL